MSCVSATGPSAFGVSGEEIPQDVICRDAGRRIEIGIEGDLAGHVQHCSVPGMPSPNQSVEPDSSACSAVCTDFVNDGRDVALVVAQRRRWSEVGTVVTRICAPVVERLIL